MKRYLVYDSHCAKCTQIANSAQELAGSKLVILSVHSSEAIALLNQAHPNGWRHAPYLVEVDDKEHVKAWTGTQAVVHLIQLVGLWKAWKLWVVAHQRGVLIPWADGATQSLFSERRRQFLKNSVVAGAVAFLAQSLSLSHTDVAIAQPSD